METKPPAPREAEVAMRVISAGIIIFRPTEEGPKFLLLYHGRNYWNFAKGKLEAAERSWDAAVREVEEETGLKKTQLRFVRDFKTQERFVFRQGTQKIFKIVILYLAETNESTVVVSKEHDGYGWFTYSAARRILSKHKDSVRILRNAYEFIQKGRVPGGRPNTERRNPHVSRGSAGNRPPQGMPGSRERTEPES